MKKKSTPSRATIQSSSLEELVAEATRTHAFRGNLDTCGPTTITGWLYDSADPGEPYDVEIRVDGKPVARCTNSPIG